MAETAFTLKTEFIELHKLLKFTGLCDSGGEAKHAIAEGKVRVNGQPEKRKAFKVRAGHVVEIADKKITVSAP